MSREPQISFTNVPQRTADFEVLQSYIQDRLRQIELGQRQLQTNYDKLRQSSDLMLAAHRLSYTISQSQQQDSSVHKEKETPLLLPFDFSDAELVPGEEAFRSLCGRGITLPYQWERHWMEGTITVDNGMLLGDLRQANGWDIQASWTGRENPKHQMGRLLDPTQQELVVFETFTVPEHVDINDYSLHYQDGSSAVSSTALPTLTMTLEAKEPQAITTIHFLPSDFQMPGRLERIRIIEEFGRQTLMEPQQSLPYTLSFVSDAVRRIELVFTQPHGHYVPMMTWQETLDTGVRFAPKFHTLDDLGYKDGHLSVELGTDVPSPAYLFQPPSRLASPVILSAKRHALELEGITAGVLEHREQGAWAFPAISYPDYAEAVYFQGHADLPSSFPEGTWVQYWISFDEGANWHTLDVEGVCSGDVERLTQHSWVRPRVGVVSVNVEVPFRIRCDLQRPENSPHESPVVYPLYMVAQWN